MFLKHGGRYGQPVHARHAFIGNLGQESVEATGIVWGRRSKIVCRNDVGTVSGPPRDLTNVMREIHPHRYRGVTEDIFRKFDARVTSCAE